MAFYGNRSLNDAYLIFSTIDGCNDYIDHKIEPIGKIYAKDYINYNAMRENKVNSSHKKRTLTIITNSPIDILEDYYLLDLKNMTKWRVVNNEINDSNQQKGLSANPCRWQILTLQCRG